MRFLNTRVDPPARVAAALRQAPGVDPGDVESVESVVRAILADVRARGDAAVRDCLRRFDGVELADLAVGPEEWAAAVAGVAPEFGAAVDVAAANVRRFHEWQRRESWIEERDGARLGQLIRPLERVGIHVPAGKAPLPSTLIMAAVPARVAGPPP